ncbi:hypothetical protein LZ32DRAFT_603244 [Colletotrichum eremochloae]|nr:hypothetical protein LZ32DRAFT_603244 [Colletotrichum eremochloae]
MMRYRWMAPALRAICSFLAFLNLAKAFSLHLFNHLFFSLILALYPFNKIATYHSAVTKQQYRNTNT